MTDTKKQTKRKQQNRQDAQGVIRKIRKRDGRLVKYDKQRIIDAIFSALLVSNKKPEEENLALAQRLADKVEKKLVDVYSNLNRHPQVEEIQDLVEAALIEEKLFKALKHYVNYRQIRRFIREEKKALLNKDTLEPIEKQMSLTALQILQSRYFIKDKHGRVIESVSHLFARSAIVAVLQDIVYDDKVINKKVVFKKGKKYYKDYLSPEATALDLDFVIHDKEVKEFLETIKPKMQQIPKKIEDLHSGYRIGKYPLMYGHLSRIAYLYDEVKFLFGKKGVKISFNKLLDLISSGYFDKLEPTVTKFYDMLMSREFLPNSPTLMNAGHRLGQLSACFVLDIEDDLKQILLTATHVGIVFQSGGGVGINYGKLRPAGDVVASTNGVASGPLSFMRIIDTVTDVIKQGGKRRGANMGVLDVFHPDIEDFIRVKEDITKFTNFNLSVGFWKTFFDALKQRREYELINPRTKKVVKTVDPDFLLEQIAQSAWRSAEPGCLFFDNINKHNVLKKVLGNVRSTNPCGEQPLYAYESCNLGSIDIAKCVVEKKGKKVFDWAKYRRLIRSATRFLDGIIDINSYPLPLIRYSTRRVRKVGLGVMGVADALFKLGIPYNSVEAYELMSRWAEELSYYSMLESVNLAKERGVFALFEESDYMEGKLPVSGVYDQAHSKVEKATQNWTKLIELIKEHGIRNSMTTTLAPTGSISMIADTSGGLEPQFALVYKKNLAVGSFFVVDAVFDEYLKRVKRDDTGLKDLVAQNYGRIGGLDDNFDHAEQRTFVTAQEIHWLDHLIAQYLWQRWVSASISKTINMPTNVTAHDIKHAYLIGHELGLKGLTIFRDGSRTGVIEYTGKMKKFNPKPSSFVMSVLQRMLNAQDGVYVVRKDYSLELVSLMEKAQDGQDAEKQRQLSLEDKKGKAKSTQDKDAEPKEHTERCPVCGSSRIVHESGCEKCIDCGWSACSVG